MDSCHHRSWLMNIPKGQFIRFRRNCTEISDYKQQAKLIEERYIKKGYIRPFLQQKIEEVGNIERETLLRNKEKRELNFSETPLILDYNIQYRKLETIIRKHGNILSADRHLVQLLLIRPRFIYRRAPTLRDLVAKSVLDPPSKKTFTFLEGKGFYPWKNCYACRHTKFSKRK